MAYMFSNQKPIKPVQRPMGAVEGGMPASRPRGAGSRGLLTLVVLIIIVVGGIYLVATYTGVNIFGIGGISAKSNWQAVFLDNGQVYFGKISRVDSTSVTLKNIYYLQVVTQPLQTSQTGAAATDQQQPQQQPEQRLTLIKLGNEIHGPFDEMTINRDHVVIVEDLRDDGRVVQAINDYLKQQGKK